VRQTSGRGNTGHTTVCERSPFDHRPHVLEIRRLKRLARRKKADEATQAAAEPE